MTYRIRLRPHVVGAFLFVGLLISLCLVIAFAIPPRNAHAAHFAGQGCSVLLREGVLSANHRAFRHYSKYDRHGANRLHIAIRTDFYGAEHILDSSMLAATKANAIK